MQLLLKVWFMLWKAVDAAIKVEWTCHAYCMLIKKGGGFFMGTHERVEFALPNWQADDQGPIDECNYIGCRRPIYRDEKNWELFGTWFCSAICVAKHVDAKKVYPERFRDGEHEEG